MAGQRNFAPRHRRESDNRAFNGRKHIEMLYASANWQQYRAKFLAVNPRCYNCGKRATVVDHLFPHLGCVKLFEKLDNHIPLCESDHNRVTALFDRRYRAGNNVNPKISWFMRNREMNDLTFRLKVLPVYP